MILVSYNGYTTDVVINGYLGDMLPQTGTAPVYMWWITGILMIAYGGSLIISTRKKEE